MIQLNPWSIEEKHMPNRGLGTASRCLLHPIGIGSNENGLVAPTESLNLVVVFDTPITQRWEEGRAVNGARGRDRSALLPINEDTPAPQLSIRESIETYLDV